MMKAITTGRKQVDPGRFASARLVWPLIEGAFVRVCTRVKRL